MTRPAPLAAWGSGLGGLPAASLRLVGDPDAAPVIVHHGFLVEHHYWVRDLVPRLVDAGRCVILMEEHAIRTIDSAHSLGHDSELPLAQSLSHALDVGRIENVDLVAWGTGAASGLLLAANDIRVGRVAVVDPELAFVDARGSIESTSVAAAVPSFVEPALELECHHDSVAAVEPVADLEMSAAGVGGSILWMANTSSRAVMDGLAATVALPNDNVAIYTGRAPSLADQGALDRIVAHFS